MKKYLWILIVALILPLNTKAFELERTFETVQSNRCYYEKELIIESYDNNGTLDGYMSCGGPYCTKYNLDNKLVWNKEIATTNEEITWEESNGDVIIGRLDESKNPLWIKNFGGNGTDYIEDAIKSYNNNGIHDGYILIGTTTSTNIDGLNPGMFFLKFSLEGQELWKKNTDIKVGNVTYGVIKSESILAAIEYGYGALSLYKETGPIFEIDTNIYTQYAFFSENSEGKTDGIISVGSMYADGQERPVIAKYDLNGNIVWEKILRSEVGYYSSGILLKNEKEEVIGYLVVGTSSPNYEEYQKGTMVAYDFFGNELWNDNYESNQEAFEYTDLTKSYNSKGKFNGYVVVGKSYHLRKRYDDEQNVITPQGNFNYNKKAKITQLGIKQMVAPMQCNSEKTIYAKYTFKEYPIIKKETNEGTITVDDKAHEGTVIKLDVKAKDGYYLRKVTVKDEDGNEIEVKNDNTFVMPKGKVTVEAIFAKIINPETASTISIGIIVVIALSLAIYLTTKKKQAPES